MPIDVVATLQRGDRELMEFLHYCVFVQEPAPLFVWCARDYRLRPTPERGLALYEVFCGPHAPARVHAPEVLPPTDLRLERQILRLQQEIDRFCAPPPAPCNSEDAPPLARPPVPNAPITLFDHVVAHLIASIDGALHAPGREFDPSRTAFENLPGGTLTTGQRAFVENTWRGRLRPRLLAAGFARLASIGQ